MAAVYNFTIEKGSAFYISFQYTDSSNNIINLTNYCARLSIQSVNTSPTTKLTYLTDTVTPDYSFIVSPQEGKIVFQLSATATNNLNFNNALYDLDIKLPNEQFPGAGPNITRIVNGGITVISRNITEPEPFVCNTLTDPNQCLTCE